MAATATRIALIGSGFIADVHLQVLALMEGVKVTALCDTVRARADRLAKKHGMAVLEALREKNLHLLTSTNKDLDLIEQIYGEQFTETKD